MKTIRCKFICQTITQSMGSVPTENGSWRQQPVYSTTFQVVSRGSEDDKKFFAATPSGQMSIGTSHVPAFEVGKKYYLDITEAED